MKITYVTGNDYKFQVAQKALGGLAVALDKQDIDLPEIQNPDVEKIASFSAKYGCDKLQKPILVADAGFYIPALKGFPGPFIKFINQWLTAKQLLALIEGESDRSVEVRECLAYCQPNEEPIVFTSSLYGTLSEKEGPQGRTMMNSIFIPKGYDKVESEIPQDEMQVFWHSGTNWQQFREYLMSNKLTT